MSNECNITSECTLANGVLRECYRENIFSEEVFFCDCSNYHGWVGENCDEETPFVYWERAVSIVYVIFQLYFVLIPITRTVFFYTCYRLKTKKPVEKQGNNVALSIAFFIWTLSAFFIANVALRVRTFYDPNFFVVKVFNFRETIQAGYYDCEYTTFLLGTICHLLAIVLIMFSWLSVLVKVSEIFPNTENIISERSLQKIIATSSLLISVAFITLFILTDKVFLTVFTSVLTLVGTLFFLVTYFRFRKVTKTMIGSGSSKQLNLIATTFKVNVTCFTLITVLSAIFFALATQHLRVLGVGAFNYIQVVREVTSFITLVALSYTSYYVHRIVVNISKSEKRKDWLLCGNRLSSMVSVFTEVSESEQKQVTKKSSVEEYL